MNSSDLQQPSESPRLPKGNPLEMTRFRLWTLKAQIGDVTFLVSTEVNQRVTDTAFERQRHTETTSKERQTVWQY